jgi:NAD(P)-dependent dehydrogenase (short-subunit alcohol dehydrogenase family)
MSVIGRTAIVTGAGTGLGLAFAARLVRDGANVVLADLKGAEAAAATLADAGHSAMGLDADVSSEASVRTMVEATLRRFGAIDILVNNAAVASTLKLTTFERLTVPDWQHVLAVNTIGVFLCCRAVAPHMRSRRQGRIVNVTSGTAFKGAPYLLHYVASKGAVISMTRALARELGGDNITVNAISPGYTLTEGNLANAEFLAAQREAAIASRALPRDAYPDDLVGAVAFLASDDARFITGQILAVEYPSGGGRLDGFSVAAR